MSTLSPNHSLISSQTKHSAIYTFPSTRRAGGGLYSAIRATSATEKSGIKIQRNPPESKLTELGVRQWPKWGCPPSKFPWTYEAKEICYILEGKVKVTPNGANESVEIGAGDLVVFPKGMSCTWNVSVAVDKHYNFE
ncbi:putative rmlC-like jelly roll protein [Lupinus albus]|uniref:Putative rmlC-like jelly roll protein n=1 Tax=Lupinus albus TaxID=3870 RepID=A0A6A4QEY3_LUPAL|nr:putative rmlC-like jelly roll protein [Lupinus albus]